MNAKAPAVFLMLALCTIGCHSAGSQPAQHPRGYGEGWTVNVDSRTEIEPCRRPPADKSGATSVMLDATADFPCVIRELPVRARLSADVSDDHPSPSHNVVKAPSGGYFSTAQQTTEGRVVQWSATGEFQRSYGQRGDGPGEFSGGGDLKLIPHQNDRLFVIDDRNTWSLLDGDLNFVRSFPGLHSTRATGALLLTRAGEVVSTGPQFLGGADGYFFRVMDLSGALINAFGEIPSPEIRQAWPALGRRASLNGDSTFWVAPIEGNLGGSSLELWSVDGSLLRSIERHAPWLPTDPYAEPDDPRWPDLPLWGLLNVDEEGLIWTVVTVRDVRWQSPETLERLDLSEEEYLRRQYDSVLEVIDPAANVVLTSVVFDSPYEVPFTNTFPGTRSFYRATEDSLGFNSVEIFEVQLVAAPAPPTSS